MGYIDGISGLFPDAYYPYFIRFTVPMFPGPDVYRPIPQTSVLYGTFPRLISLYPGDGEGIPWVSAWASYQIRKIAGCTCAGNAGKVFFPPPRVSPDMHHGTCVTHVPCCIPKYDIRMPVSECFR